MKTETILTGSCQNYYRLTYFPGWELMADEYIRPRSWVKEVLLQNNYPLEI
jgi:hypothetical protein